MDPSSVICPSCGAENPPGFRFCGSCGSGLAEQTAGTGEVLIGAGTEPLVRDAFRTEPIEPLGLKGKAEPVPAFRVLELLDQVPAFTRSIETPFVGRGDVLLRLEDVLASTIETRAPQVATIVGPPGIG